MDKGFVGPQIGRLLQLYRTTALGTSLNGFTVHASGLRTHGVNTGKGLEKIGPFGTEPILVALECVDVHPHALHVVKPMRFRRRRVLRAQMVAVGNTPVRAVLQTNGVVFARVVVWYIGWPTAVVIYCQGHHRCQARVVGFVARVQQNVLDSGRVHLTLLA